MPNDPEASPLDSIIALARQIIGKRPSCASRASEIIMWASELRERRLRREELAALVDAACESCPPDNRRKRPGR
jgi:hypothetical protein